MMEKIQWYEVLGQVERDTYLKTCMAEDIGDIRERRTVVTTGRAGCAGRKLYGCQDRGRIAGVDG